MVVVVCSNGNIYINKTIIGRSDRGLYIFIYFNINNDYIKTIYILDSILLKYNRNIYI